MSREQRLSFGDVATSYDQARPGYPSELLADLVAITGLDSESRVLEIGSGTGKATELLASVGCQILCVEPDPAMAAVAIKKFAGKRVDVVIAGFEDWDVTDPGDFDLVLAAQVWHWVDGPEAFAKAASALGSSGWLALVWNTPGIDAEMRVQFNGVYESRAPHLVDRIPGWLGKTDTRDWAQRIAASGLFGPAIHVEHPWRQSYSAERYTALMATQSDHLMLPAKQRDDVLAALADVIAGLGGAIVVDYICQGFLAPVAGG